MEKESGPLPLQGAAATTVRLFVVYAAEDAAFVAGFLVPALGLEQDEVLLSTHLELGKAQVAEHARGAQSPVTVVVVSPHSLGSPWVEHASQLALHRSIETSGEDQTALIAAVVSDCDLPLLTRSSVFLDFRTTARWEVEVERLRKKLDVGTRARAQPEPLPDCPYPGMRAFEAREASNFHGRDREIAEALGHLRAGVRELYVIGPSGSGKSSLVAAGLVPSLQSEPSLAGGRYVVHSMRPGMDPLRALASELEQDADRADGIDWAVAARSKLKQNAGSDRLVLFVDQLEELFAIPTEKRKGFEIALRQLRGEEFVVLVATLRANLYGVLMESGLWEEAGGRRFSLDVPPLRGAQLREAIEAPARALGVYFEPLLVERLLNEVAGEVGALPLLQDTLLQLWHRRTRRLLRLAEYEALGVGEHTGLAMTVSQRADGALNELPPPRREIARRVLLRLVHFGEGDHEPATRRQQSRAALSSAGETDEEVSLVVEHLANRRLVTTSGGEAGQGGRLDLAHEVLLTAWPILADWIQTRRTDEQRRRRLESRAAEWLGSEKRETRLLDSHELHEVHSWLTDEVARDLRPSKDARALITASTSFIRAAEDAARADDLEKKVRRQRGRLLIAAVLVVLSASITAVSILVFVARDRQARAQRQLARKYIAQGHSLLIGGQRAQSLPYLVAAREAGVDDMGLRMLFRWAREDLRAKELVHGGGVVAVAWSPDGESLVTGSWDKTARVWNVDKKRATHILRHEGEVRVVSWSPDGRIVATGGWGNTARIWDAKTGARASPSLAHRGLVVALAWSPDGRRLATGSADEIARVWNAKGKAVELLLHKGRILAVAWDAAGRRLATGSSDGTARLWTVDKGREAVVLRGHAEAVRAIAWSPDGRRVVTGSEDGTAQIWDTTTKRALVSALVHDGVVTTVAWSPDGSRVATGSWDGTAQVWDAETGAPMTPALAHEEGVVAVSWSHDGSRVATASWDKTARVWDAGNGMAVTPPLLHDGWVLAVSWSADDAHIATGSLDNKARVWDVAPDASRLDEWREAADEGPYFLNAHDALVRRRRSDAP